MANEDEVAEAARESQAGDIAANPPSAAGRTMARNSAVMATGTIASRVTGVLRDVAMTAALGFFLVSDAFSLGNSLPTIVYILVIGGALNAVFIPQLVRKMKEDSDGGQAYADRLLTLVATLLLVLSIAAVIAAPWIVDLYTPSDYPQNEFDLAVAFARLCLPQIFFYGLYAMLSQVLNSRGRFGAPMFAPIANNIVAIATFGLFIVIAGHVGCRGRRALDRPGAHPRHRHDAGRDAPGPHPAARDVAQRIRLAATLRLAWRGPGQGRLARRLDGRPGPREPGRVRLHHPTRDAGERERQRDRRRRRRTDDVPEGAPDLHAAAQRDHRLDRHGDAAGTEPHRALGQPPPGRLGRGAHHAHGGGAHRPDRGDPDGQRRGSRGPALRLRRRDSRPGRD